MRKNRALKRSVHAHNAWKVKEVLAQGNLVANGASVNGIGGHRATPALVKEDTGVPWTAERRSKGALGRPVHRAETTAQSNHVENQRIRGKKTDQREIGAGQRSIDTEAQDEEDLGAEMDTDIAAAPVMANGAHEAAQEAPEGQKKKKKRKKKKAVLGMELNGAESSKEDRPDNATNGVHESNGAPLKQQKRKEKGRDTVSERRRAIQETREALPVYQERERIVQEIMHNKAVVIVGETGSGKTTQIPQFLHDAGLTKGGMVAITQPRRIAAISIAKRVAEEMDSKVGETVGYAVRFDDTTSAATKLKYMTDGLLLRELLLDNNLSKYSAIILDEAHERTLRTDVLFGMVKSIQKERPDLKIIVMSATLNAERFSEYFDGAKILHVPGRQFPVRLFHSEVKQEDYMDAALVAIFQLHMEQPLGDFLVFMTGQEEIVNLNKLVEDYARQLPPQCPKLLVCPLYAKLPTEQQSQIFQPTPPGTRKVILATNIAETSITISGIRYVIDTGMTKVRAINPRTGIDTLAVQPISKASARQRMGRAGREAPGFCYRLYPEEAFNSLPEDIEPEILRCSLSSVTLMLKASGVDDVINFDYMDKPDRQSIVRALEELYALGCLNDKGNLTSLGKRMASLPLEPVFSKMLLNSVEYNCTSEVISIIAMLSVDVIFSAPANARETAAAAKSKFVNHDGDHLTLLNVLKSYLSVNRSQSWCAENFLSHRSLKQVLDIRQQLVEIAQRLDIDTEKECAEDEFENVTMCLLSGAFMNVAVKLPGGSSFKTLGSGQEVWIHPSSVLFGKKVGAVVYTELMKTTKLYMRNVSVIQPEWLQRVAPHYYSRTSVTTR